ncbi:uncharacterized protein LOC115626419 [Scaptodrosophila lebanonensis]|uniref:Uncharacterized protein LOC115626419 n=1 Tax=Drosophila lebanonensis TaxID=7225 RepID=A0A6J2TRQ5_DROLE|nr:uncharacterized protein LOC115626419 [Scaptodrosophila lebanonensis]
MDEGQKSGSESADNGGQSDQQREQQDGEQQQQQHQVERQLDEQQKDQQHRQQVMELIDRRIALLPKRDTQERRQHVVLQLGDDHVGATDTERVELEMEPKPASLPDGEQATCSKSRQTLPITIDQHKLDEAKVLVKDMLETILPRSETDEAAQTAQHPIICTEERIQNILHLLDHFTHNLEAIEGHLLASGNIPATKTIEGRADEKSKPQLDIPHESPQLRLSEIMEMPRPHCEGEVAAVAHLSTQTNESTASLVLNVTRGASISKAPRKSNALLDMRPPCERRHHTITISANNAPPRPQPVQRRTLGARTVQSLSDFAAALCLCLQVNKDCIFCLGFFIAFVVSASFLTAFFYRTLSLTTQSMRLTREMLATSATVDGDAGLRTGYYYFSHGRHARFT